MMQNKLVVALLALALCACFFQPSCAREGNKDMVLINGEHGCGPKLLYKSGKIEVFLFVKLLFKV